MEWQAFKIRVVSKGIYSSIVWFVDKDTGFRKYRKAILFEARKMVNQF